MRKREREEMYAITAVTGKTEKLTADREKLGVGELRVLLRIAGLTESGALITSTDLQRANLSSKRAVRESLLLLQRKHQCVSKEGGGKIAGRLVLTSKGQRICQDYASALGRAAAHFLAFEAVKPYNRTRPRKNQL